MIPLRTSFLLPPVECVFSFSFSSLGISFSLVSIILGKEVIIVMELTQPIPRQAAHSYCTCNECNKQTMIWSSSSMYRVNKSHGCTVQDSSTFLSMRTLYIIVLYGVCSFKRAFLCQLTHYSGTAVGTFSFLMPRAHALTRGGIFRMPAASHMMS